MSIHTLTPDGTAVTIGICADVLSIHSAVVAAIAEGLDLVLSIRPHARDEDLLDLGSVAHLVHAFAEDLGRTAWASFEPFPHGVRIRFDLPPNQKATR